jgi:hypothetical protein
MCKFCLFLLFFLFFEGSAFADYEYEMRRSSLSVDNNHVCLLDKTPRYAVESYDKSAVMVSETGYVLRRDLLRCQSGRAVHVHLIPSNVGVLSDVNVSKNVYVALDFVSVRPMVYLATVAHMGSSKNLVSIHGAYPSGTRPSELTKFAFGGSGNAGTSIISPDGRFVAPDGQIDCTDDAYPGVWDIQRNRRVKNSDDNCAGLFK